MSVNISNFTNNLKSTDPNCTLKPFSQKRVCKKNTIEKSKLHEIVKNIEERFEEFSKLLEGNIDVDERSDGGFTPLYILASQSSVNALKAISLLVFFGANIHASQGTLPGYITPLQNAKYTDFVMEEEMGEKGSPRTTAILESTP